MQKTAKEMLLTLACKPKALADAKPFSVIQIASVFDRASWTNSRNFLKKFLKENLLCAAKKAELGELLNVI